MALGKKYNASEAEPRIQQDWQVRGIYHFNVDSESPVYSIDTPPPTVSGHLHLGHIYSYSHADFIARFHRMNGYNVFYPMGYDDNGLPTERLVEKHLGVQAYEIGRTAFVEKCLEVSKAVEQDYQALWERAGLSIDWRYSYRTIARRARLISQLSFLMLFRTGDVYRKLAPAIWCPECKTSIAQAELNDSVRDSEFYTIEFLTDSGEELLIATTRPELLPACVAVFVHPEDKRYHHLIGRNAIVPVYEQVVPIIADPSADPAKGTGAVMCCTFGDTTDISWWRSYQLPYIRAIDENGKMSGDVRFLSGLDIREARRVVLGQLNAGNLIIDRKPTQQSVRVHERCDTPVEYLLLSQWFVSLLQHKQDLLELGEKVRWVPDNMESRYRNWVENLNWDWCISRQRYYGIPFPVWYCKDCGEIILAQEEQLPVDPLELEPSRPCPSCGSNEFIPEKDVMDTWATSSMTPQIVGGWLDESAHFYEKVFPFSLRPQAHEIIRTWAFYTLAKSYFHFKCLPWDNILISGWGIAGEGMGKISKSRGGGPMSPIEMIHKYSADAVRYWAASSGPGRDAIISEEKIQAGARLVTKLWNVARFCERFLTGGISEVIPSDLSPTDRWILSSLYNLIKNVTEHFNACEYSAAKGDVETFFWTELANNYIEMSKHRLYTQRGSGFLAAKYTLYWTFLSIIKMLAPFLPYVTEEIYLNLFSQSDGCTSIHISHWPAPEVGWYDPDSELVGSILLEVATAVRRYKSERNMSLGAELSAVKLALKNKSYTSEQGVHIQTTLVRAVPDIASVTRALRIEFYADLPSASLDINPDGQIAIGIDLNM